MLGSFQHVLVHGKKKARELNLNLTKSQKKKEKYQRNELYHLIALYATKNNQFG